MRRLATVALGLLLSASGCGGDSTPTHRVILLAVDGADWNVLRPLIDAGELPHFERLVREGASGDLRSLPGFLSPALWTTIATGARPRDHGILDFTYPGPDGEPRMVTSNLRERRALWDVLSERGRSVGVYGWLATWPAYPLEGTLVSAYMPYLFERSDALDKVARPMKGTYLADVPDVTYPPEVADEMRSLLLAPDELPLAELERFADFESPLEADDEVSESLLRSIRFTYAADRAFAEIARRKYAAGPEDLHTLYLGGADVLSHRMWRFAFESPLPASAAQRKRFGRAIPAYYRRVDEWLGWYLERRPDDTTLVVCSDHGFRALQEELEGVYNSGTHRLNGVLALLGPDVEPGARIEGATLLDVAPTLLALLGLPAAEDMPGRVLAEIFRSAAVPATERIGTYETSPFRTGDGAESGIPSAVDDEVLERLRSLGYLGDDMAAGEGDE